MGKYSKALEKAKVDADRQFEPQVEPVSQEIEAVEAAETVTKLKPVAPEETPPLGPEHTGISGEIDSWDEKLREIISGNAKQVAESIRMLRTRIFYPESGEPPRSILVTSAIPGEGKSFICANLGVSVAQGVEKQALLVECDLRRPSLSKLFGLSNARGIVDFLQSGTPVEQLIQQTSIPKLAVLSSGKPPENPAELIDSQKMSSLIQHLENQHPDRLIIFDSPPLQAAAETDILAKMVNKIILVVRWGYARREHTRQLIDTIGKDKILGVIFNAYEMSRLESKLQGYYYGYKDYYSSSYSKYYQQQPKKRWGRRQAT